MSSSMSGFLCSNGSRSVMRGAVRDITRAQGSTTLSRWLSSCASRRPYGKLCCESQWPAWKPRYSVSGTSMTKQRCDGGRRTFFASKITKDYEELPRDYRDQVGLAFGRELSEAETEKIFGTDIGAKRANHLLRILHGRRVAGTLEDPAFAIHTAQFTEEETSRAMAYLRKTVRVEEVRNAGLRAEDELDQMDEDARQAAARKAKANKEVEGEGEDDAAEVYKPDPTYGPSKFDEMRARHKAKVKAKERQLREEQKAGEAAQEVSSVPVTHEEKAQGIANPRIAEYYKNAQSDLDAPPELKTWERILPSATVVALILGFMAAIGMVYEEPSPRYRIFRDVTTSQATLATLIAINSVIFLGWRVPPLWSLFNRYMIFVVATVRPITLFTAAFSHTKLSHLIVNMVPLWFVGTSLHDEIGRADFLTLYLGCGAVGFLGSLVTYTLRGWLTVTSLGASGATLGLCSAYFWEHRTDGFKIFGLPPDGVHGIVFLALITAMQLAGLGKTIKYKVDLASHLSGIVAGILGIELLNRTARRKKQLGGEEDKAVIDILSGEAAESSRRE